MTEIKLALEDPRVQLRALELAVERLASTPLQGAAQILTHLREAIEEQVKPAVEEPREFGSIICATCGPGLVGVLWQAAPWKGKHYWESETGAIDVWSELTDVEVLRVGIGEPKPQPVEDLVGVLSDPNWGRVRRFCSLRRDCRMADGHDGGCQP